MPSNSKRKILLFNEQLCIGCQNCEEACSAKNGDAIKFEKARIKFKSFPEFNFVTACQHCKDPAPCQKACPQGAIGRDDITDAITISKVQCIGCGECIDACPFGAISIDKDDKKAYKCNLCKGNPECVNNCQTEALTYGYATDETDMKYQALFNSLNQ